MLVMTSAVMFVEWSFLSLTSIPIHPAFDKTIEVMFSVRDDLARYSHSKSKSEDELQ